jgi:hypothetical protein
MIATSSADRSAARSVSATVMVTGAEATVTVRVVRGRVRDDGAPVARIADAIAGEALEMLQAPGTNAGREALRLRDASPAVLLTPSGPIRISVEVAECVPR